MWDMRTTFRLVSIMKCRFDDRKGILFIKKTKVLFLRVANWPTFGKLLLKHEECVHLYVPISQLIDCGFSHHWVKKSIEYEVEDSRPRGRPWRTWREVVQKDVKHIN